VDALPGVVHPGVDAPEAADGLVADALHVRALRHVRRDRQRRGPALAHDRVELVLRARREDEPVPLRRKLARKLRADAAAGARDDDDLAVHGRASPGPPFSLASAEFTIHLE